MNRQPAKTSEQRYKETDTSSGRHTYRYTWRHGDKNNWWAVNDIFRKNNVFAIVGLIFSASPK